MARSKIYSNLRATEFIIETDRFSFHFSSLFYKRKFEDEIEEFRKKIGNKLKTLYLMPVDLKNYADIVFYSKIEKRGFYVIDRETGEVIIWLGNIILNGVIKMNVNYEE